MASSVQSELITERMNRMQLVCILMCSEWIRLHYPHCESVAVGMERAMIRQFGLEDFRHEREKEKTVE